MNWKSSATSSTTWRSSFEDSYSTLERKVEERTRQLEVATQAKSRFLATASHDLRQPLHALGLFVAQLRGSSRAEDRKRVVERIEMALSAMNDLFNALLDVTKLDAGALAPTLTDFPVAHTLQRIETTFTEVAREKGLSLRVINSGAWVHSDGILLERIVSNFVSNAIRYTSQGRVVVGCRKQGNAAPHRSMGYRARHPGGSASEYFRRVLSAQVFQHQSARRARTWARDRGPFVPVAQSSDRREIGRGQGLLLFRDRADGQRTGRWSDESSRNCAQCGGLPCQRASLSL